MSSAPVAAASAPATVPAPRVHFQPSAALLASAGDAADDMQNDDGSQSPRRNNGSGGRSKRKSANSGKDRAAAAAAGNNTSPPALSVKAVRAARGLGGKKRLHTDTAPNPSLSTWRQQEIEQRNASRSRSPGNRSGASAGNGNRHHDTPKKRPMRPIEDVLSRLRHEVGSGPDGDAALAPFIVAYIDRVFGDQEVGFAEFFESEDTKDVPLHRISYLRYYDAIIWNRAARYDAVFGSSNSNKTLPDWLTQAQELKDAQELRWARMLAREALEEAAEQRLLARLAVQIREQRDEIEARNQMRLADVDTASQAGSAFDFAERDEEDEDLTDEEEPSKPAVMQDVAPAVDATQPAAAAAETASTQNGADGVTFEALPPRAARGARGQPAVATPVAVAASAAAPAATSAASSTAAATSSAVQGASAAASAPSSSASSGSSRPVRDDDGHIVCTASLLASSGGSGVSDAASDPKVLRSSPVRVSLEHFDWDFLRKRLARKLHVEGGARQVKRLYVQRADGTTTRLNADNFRRMLHDGAHMLLMQEQAPFPSREAAAAALLAAPKDADERAPSVSVGAPVSGAAAASRPSAPAAPSAAAARPTHFVSLRITNPELLASLASIQGAMTAFDPRYAPFLVPQGTFHLTISLLALPGKPELRAAAVDTAVKTLRQAAPRIRELLHAGLGGDSVADAASVVAAAASSASGPLSLTLRGVSSFNDAVVFADVARDEARSRLSAVAAFLADEFEKAGVGCAANKRTKGDSKKKKHQCGKGKPKSKHAESATPAVAGTQEEEQHESFTPHLTLAKLSRAAPAGKGKGKHSKAAGKKQPHLNAAQDGEQKEDEEDAEDAPMPPAKNPFDALQREDSTATVASEASALAAPPAAVAAEPPTPSQPAGAAGAAGVRNPSTSAIRRLHSSSYRAFQDADLGTQPIVAFDLCSMQDRKQADGYYAVLAQIDVSAQPGSKP